MRFELETPSKYRVSEALTREAFWNVYQPGCTEHLVLHQLRTSPAFINELSYLAVEEQQVIGQIAYSKLFINGTLSDEVICFGPLSVAVDHQKEGIGQKLITFTLEKAKELGYQAVLITGDPGYYHRFGFKTAKEFGIQLDGISSTDDAPYFMALELNPQYFSRQAPDQLGIFSFAPEFSVTSDAVKAFEQNFPNKKKRAPQDTDL
ncbi:hypothetical protein IGI37_002890 [Enterococcus sp. AZ194]|uniref:GNAT family N-acetyltransferase n=1 Tax=Enterococcus sp. AZ194 TaxID=2774629 RepID=UPI003F215D43